MLAIALTSSVTAFAQAPQKSTNSPGSIKLLERITYQSSYDLSDYIFEYDDKNRIVKITGSDGKTTALTYKGDELFSVQGVKVTKNGNTITLGNEIFTLSYDGYITKKEDSSNKGYTVRYHYKAGNIVKVTETLDGGNGHTIYEYKYDDKKSPFLNCRTPKWFLSYQLNGFGLKNNVTEVIYTNEFVHDGKNVKETLEHYVFSFEYDSDGYPTKETHFEMGDEEVSIFIYRGQTNPSGSANASNLSAKEAASEAPRVIATWEKLLQAAMMEEGRVVEAGKMGFIPPKDSDYWIYDLTTKGKIAATLKVKLNELEASAIVGSEYNADGDCFVHTVTPKFAKLVPKFVNSDQCTAGSAR
jgi:hypothetical protein